MRSVRHIDVFVASPGDVNSEREMVVDVANELNIAWGRELGVHLDIIRWETHTVPDFGDDAQSVINNQIPKVYDVFIGIFWTRFGTPTHRASSGTEEEFLRAYENFKSLGAPRLLLYFNKSKVDADSLDLDQLAKIRSFKEKASQLGGYYAQYPNIDSFRQLVRTHLSAILNEFKDKNVDPRNHSVTNFQVEMPLVENDEKASQAKEGDFEVVTERPELLDILAEGEEKMEQISGVFVEIVTEMGAYTERLNGFVEDMVKANSAKEKKRISDLLADNMSAFATFIRDKYGLGFDLLADVITGVGDVIVLVPKDKNADDEEGLRVLYQSFLSLNPVVRSSSDALRNLSSIVENATPGTASYRRSQQELVISLNEQVGRGETVGFLIDQVIAAIKNQLNDLV